MTTSAVVGIIIVLALVGIGVGGWLLSHRHGGAKAVAHAKPPDAASAPSRRDPAQAGERHGRR